MTYLCIFLLRWHFFSCSSSLQTHWFVQVNKKTYQRLKLAHGLLVPKQIGELSQWGTLLNMSPPGLTGAKDKIKSTGRQGMFNSNMLRLFHTAWEIRSEEYTLYETSKQALGNVTLQAPSPAAECVRQQILFSLTHPLQEHQSPQYLVFPSRASKKKAIPAPRSSTSISDPRMSLSKYS